MTETPRHISEYRYQSWQIEILIAGGILYGLFTTSDWLQQYFYEVQPISEITSNKIIFLFASFIITKVLLIGFSANLILRAVWLGYLGINFWFPNDIDYSKIKSSIAYKDKLLSEPNANQRLLILEKWCNLSFSFAILLGFFTLSLVLSLSAIIWLLSKFDSTMWMANSSPITYGIVIVILFFQLGLLEQVFIRRKHKKSYFNSRKITRFFDLITLSFLFKREFLVLKTNTNKWVLYTSVILYLLIATVVSINGIGAFYSGGTFYVNPLDDREAYDYWYTPSISSNNYDSKLQEGSRSPYGSIQSDFIDEDYVRLFLVSRFEYDRFLKKKYSEYGFQEEFVYFKSQQKQDSFIQAQNILWRKSLNDLFTVTIDTTVVKNVSFSKYVHPITKREGYVSYIAIDSLPEGRHSITVNGKELFRNGAIRERTYLFIPFIKQETSE